MTYLILNWLGDVVDTVNGTEEEAIKIAEEKTEYHSCYWSPYTVEKVNEPTEESQNKEEIKKLQKELEKVEKQLEKVRGASVLEDGWQTQRYARKARAWDALAQKKMSILFKIEDLKESA